MNVYHQLQESYRRYEHDRLAYLDKAVNAVAETLIALRNQIDAPEGKCRFEAIKKDRVITASDWLRELERVD